jgi:hypothetical protein
MDLIEEALNRAADHHLGYPTLHCYVHLTTRSELNEELPEYCATGRPDLHQLFQNIDQVVPKDEPFRAAVVACGPEDMVNTVWDQTSMRTGNTRRFDFHHETFSF